MRRDMASLHNVLNRLIDIDVKQITTGRALVKVLRFFPDG